MGSEQDKGCASEADVNVGGSPTGGIRLFATEVPADCVVVRRGGEQAGRNKHEQAGCNKDEPQ